MADNSKPSVEGHNATEFSVSELAFAIKRTVEDGFGYVRLKGEISGYRGPHSSGHCYFSLKDEKSRIDSVVWRGVFQKLRFKPEEGMEVIVKGRVTTYPGTSKYQIVIESLEPAGVGALMALLEERRKKLGAEGLFDDERKVKLPFLPKVVGVITSPTGAVIRDMLHGFSERFPVRVLVWPVRVQGETSAAEVARAINGFNALTPGGAIPRPDTLIVARGGGSLEDLWGFNEEVVVRAASESKIPLISAVGHETDWTLIDLAADARAPTPTKAAEWAVPKHGELIERVGDHNLRLKRVIYRTLEEMRGRVISAGRGLPRMQDVLGLPRQRLDTAGNRLSRGLFSNTQGHGARFGAVSGRLSVRPIRGRIDMERQKLGSYAERGVQSYRNQVGRKRLAVEGLGKLLGSLGHHSVLKRGFAIVRDEAGGMVRGVIAAQQSQILDVEFADGHVRAVPQPGGGDGLVRSGGGARAASPGSKDGVSREEHANSAPSKSPAARKVSPKKASPKKPSGGGGNQGSLF